MSRGGSMVATRTTTVTGEDGESVELVAGQSFVHVPGHWLIQQHPDLFAPAGHGRHRAKPAPPRRRATTRSRRPLELPREPLVRFDDSRPSAVRVELRRDAYHTMGDYTYGPGSEAETGGGLFGYAYSPKTNMIVVREALGPGPATAAWHAALRIDHAHIDRQAERYKADGVDKALVGLWHSHPHPADDQPSDADLRVFAGLMQHHRTDHCVALILTPEWRQDYGTFESYASWAKPRVHGWHFHHVGDDQFICTRAEVIRC
jgi:proteasome lid subunit RPN8/RPN11